MGLSLDLFHLDGAAFTALNESIQNKKEYCVYDYCKFYLPLGRVYAGIEYLLTNKLDSRFSLLFTPTEYLSSADLELNEENESSLYDRMEDFIEMPKESYVQVRSILDLIKLLSSTPSSYFDKVYDSNELNDNDVYPCDWIEGSSADDGSTLDDLKSVMDELRRFLNKVQPEPESFIFVSLG